jgi:hypothetical protein
MRATLGWGKLHPMDNVALFFHLIGALVFVAGIVLASQACSTRSTRPILDMADTLSSGIAKQFPGRFR